MSTFVVGILVFVFLAVMVAVASLFSVLPDSDADLLGDLKNRNDRKKLKCPSEKHVTR
ncbi:MAG TPA: hypothetical protein VG844_12530 [Terracidiphilus sp.]|nr:hypothetical protein [Terracidiphilus sp.]